MDCSLLLLLLLLLPLTVVQSYMVTQIQTLGNYLFFEAVSVCCANAPVG
jgi:hypothetical protein